MRRCGRFNGAARFCVRKSAPIVPLYDEDGLLQWGRTFLRAEIPSDLATAFLTTGFNGAARFCVRKYVGESACCSAGVASMGPHVFACGNRGLEAAAVFAARLLQWGRTFLRAEMAWEQDDRPAALQLQWGRTFLRAEISTN